MERNEEIVEQKLNLTIYPQEVFDLVLKFKKEAKIILVSLLDAKDQTIEELKESILYLRNGYSEYDARGCPACEYENGTFIKQCKLHEQIEELRKEVEAVTRVKDAERELRRQFEEQLVLSGETITHLEAELKEAREREFF